MMMLRISSPISFLLLLLAIFFFAYANIAIAANKVVQLRVDKQLTTDNTFVPETYSVEPPTSLQSEIEKQKKAIQQPKPLTIDIKKALIPFDRPDNPDGINPNLLKESGQFVSIADIRQKALMNNLEIKIINFQPTIAQTLVREEEAKFDNIIFAYAKLVQTDLPGFSSDSVNFTASDPALDNQNVKLNVLEQQDRYLDAEAGVIVPLRTGGTVTLSSPLQRKVTEGLTDSKEYRSALQFSFSQPLLRNAGIRVNEASINIASLNRQEEDVKTRLQTMRIVAIVDKAYWDLYEAWGNLDIRRQQYEYASQNLEMVKRRVNEGLTATIEINRAEIGVADRMEALIIAETNLKLAQRQIHFFTNDINETAEQIIIPKTQPSLVKYQFNRNQLLQDALANRLELLQQEVKLAADALNIDYLENQTLPLFTLDYQYGALSNTMNSFNNSYRNVLDGNFSDWSIGFKFEMPFTNEARKAKLENAVQQRLQRLTTKALQTLTVKREIYDALDRVDQDWQRILAARQQVLIAGINYEAELKQFNEGLRTMTEVLEALTRLGEAQIKEIRAISDYQTALIDTAFATGTLLGYSKINFQ
jgi:outer membrane protein TolC